MRKFGAILGVALCLCEARLSSQDVSKAEVFGGYSYLNFDTNSLTTPSRQSANGWETAASGYFNNWLGVEFDGSGYYKSFAEGTETLNTSDYAYIAGPRFRYGPVFVHALLGGDYLSGSYVGLSESQDSLAGAAGGGFEWPPHGRLASEVTGDYVFSRHDLVSARSLTQNNFRVAVGIAFRFGGVAKARPYSLPAQPAPQESGRSAGAVALESGNKLYEQGKYTDAFTQYFYASESDDATIKGEAQFRIGMMYLQGSGIRQDRETAVKWLKSAASLGNQGARDALAKIESGSSQ